MTQAEQLSKAIAERRAEITALIHHWQVSVGEHCPSEQQFGVWLDRHPFGRVSAGIRTAGYKQVRRNGTMNSEYLIKFASRVMNSLKTQQESPTRSATMTPATA
jgi:hypothetical protein